MENLDNFQIAMCIVIPTFFFVAAIVLTYIEEV
jgi:hypothetical protein